MLSGVTSEHGTTKYLGQVLSFIVTVVIHIYVKKLTAVLKITGLEATLASQNQ